MQPNVYLKELVARCLADRGIPGSVEIYPDLPLAKRLETGQRTHFVVQYHGHGDARLIVDEHEISCGTIGSPIERTLAERIARERRVELAA